MEGAEPTRFFVIGAPKCGTTSLCSILAEHPEVGFSIPKEPRFFSHDEIYARGFDWYHGLFPERDGKQSVGEGSTSYATDSRDTVSAQRIHQHFPDAKLVYCVRHPLERIESIWMDHRISRHVPGTSYSESVLKGDFSSDLIANPGFIETSRYQARLAPYRALFPEEQIAVLFLEDRILAPGKSLGAIFDFLGISRAGLDAEVKNRANHISSERRFPNHLGAALRRLPGWSRVHARLPGSLRGGVDRVTSTRFVERPTWSPDAYGLAADALAEDSARFLEYCGKPASFWDFDPRDRVL
jgi:hypothetical protein